MSLHRFAGRGAAGLFRCRFARFGIAVLAGFVLPVSFCAARFVPASPPITARVDHTATLLMSGKVLVAGGNGPGELRSAQLYDPESDSWSAAGNLTSGRYAHTATLLDSGKVLVVGGYGNSGFGAGGALTSVELYDPDTNTWNSWGQVPWIPSPRFRHTSTLLQSGEVLVAGGFGTGEHLSSALSYVAPQTDWIFAGTLRVRRSGSSAVRMDSGEVLLVGGTNGNILASSELYDPASRTWSLTSPMATPRTRTRVVKLASGEAMAVGGAGTDARGIASSEIFAPASAGWRSGGSMSEARFDHTATTLPGGAVLVTGGVREQNQPAFATAEIHDPVRNEWLPAGTMAAGRQGHTATLLASGKVLVVGGFSSGTGTLASAELFDQDTSLSITDVAPSKTVVGQLYSISVAVATATGPAQGSVMVSDGRGGTCGPFALDDGNGFCSLAATAAGASVLTATYAPTSGAFAPSSATTGHDVAAAGTRLAIVGHAPERTIPGETVTVASLLEVVSPGAGSPSGSVVVGDGVDECTIGQGEPDCDLTLTTRGPRTLIAVYAGDGNFAASSAQVAHLVNRLPVAASADFSTPQGVPLTQSAALGLLSAATDADGDALAIVDPGAITAAGIGGSVDLRADGSFTYLPPEGASGVASFGYQIGDGYETIQATATITVRAVNHAPSFALSADPLWPAGAGGQRRHPAFAQVVSFGSPAEAGQRVLAWHLRALGDPDGVVSTAQIALDGSLSYVLSGRTGVATFGVRLQDDGGTADGGEDTSPERTFTVGVEHGLDLSVEIDGGVDFVAGGDRIHYAITVRNAGPDDAHDAKVRDLLPFNLVDATWTCVADAGATCTAEGESDIDDVVAIPVGATLAYELVATVAAEPEAPVENAVSVASPTGLADIEETNNVATDVVTVGIFADGYDREVTSRGLDTDAAPASP